MKKIGLDFLDNRTERFVKSAVVEAARESDLGERYLQKIGELREVWLQLVGLRVVVGEHDKFSFSPMYGLRKIEIPRFEVIFSQGGGRARRCYLWMLPSLR